MLKERPKSEEEERRASAIRIHYGGREPKPTQRKRSKHKVNAKVSQLTQESKGEGFSLCDEEAPRVLNPCSMVLAPSLQSWRLLAQVEEEIYATT